MKLNYKRALFLAALPFFIHFTFAPNSFAPEINGGLMLPGNFEAVVVADSIGSARHLAVNSNGDIYVKLRASYKKGSNVAMRDTDGDGKADIIEYFSVYDDSYNYGTAMRIHKGYLYYSSSGQIFRCKLIRDN